jgi:hypothetical protein
MTAKKNFSIALQLYLCNKYATMDSVKKSPYKGFILVCESRKKPEDEVKCKKI